MKNEYHFNPTKGQEHNDPLAIILFRKLNEKVRDRIIEHEEKWNRTHADGKLNKFNLDDLQTIMQKVYDDFIKHQTEKGIKPRFNTNPKLPRTDPTDTGRTVGALQYQRPYGQGQGRRDDRRGRRGRERGRSSRSRGGRNGRGGRQPYQQSAKSKQAMMRYYNGAEQKCRHKYRGKLCNRYGHYENDHGRIYQTNRNWLWNLELEWMARHPNFIKRDDRRDQRRYYNNNNRRDNGRRGRGRGRGRRDGYKRGNGSRRGKSNYYKQLARDINVIKRDLKRQSQNVSHASGTETRGQSQNTTQQPTNNSNTNTGTRDRRGSISILTQDANGNPRVTRQIPSGTPRTRSQAGHNQQ